MTFSGQAKPKRMVIATQILPCAGEKQPLDACYTVLTRYNRGYPANMSPATSGDLADALAEALLLIRSPAEARAVLADLCTPAEIRTIGERWHVARLLDEDALTYREIHEATGVSTTTIVRVARFLRQEANGGYRVLLNRLKEASS